MIVCFKQKTAYDMRISDWSSDVCASDRPCVAGFEPATHGLGKAPMCGFGCRRAARNGHVQPGHPIVDGGAVSIHDRQKPLCPSRTALIARQRMDRWMASDARDETVRNGGTNARHPSQPTGGTKIGL